ncbi:MAG: hypothetical protein OEW40_13230, partial [Cyclobacteriaceae bacterium]|nr:hypothetical protein [Cyclobacteriaceae bacterium]
MSEAEYPDDKTFSIIPGGPFFQFLNRIHLSGRGMELAKLRTIIITLIAWLPLLLLSMLKGQAWGGETNLPFIQDLDVHIRLLVALPMFIVAEVIVHQRMLVVVREFRERNLIPDAEMERFQNAVTSARKWRNAVIAEILMIAIIYIIGYQVVWHQTSAHEASAWYSEPGIGKGTLSMAGIWFRYISLPIFQFLFLRWYYRISIWTRFLFQVSRIKLSLVPTHPDEVGGLGFLTDSVYALMPLAFAH